MLEHALGLNMRFSHHFDNSIHLLMKSLNNFSSEFKGHDIVKTDKKKHGLFKIIKTIINYIIKFSNKM